MSVNKSILVGNLGRDPEVRETSDGKAVVNLSVATSEYWKDRNTQERKSKTEWHKVVAFGSVGEFAGSFLRKGDSVYVEGKLQTRKWQDQSGQDNYTTEIVVDQRGTLRALSSRDKGTERRSDDDKILEQKGAVVSEEPAFDDDIPF